MKSIMRTVLSRRFVGVAWMVGVIGLAARAGAVGFTYMPLDEKVVAHLPKEAKAAYDKALDALDHIQYNAAMDQMQEATKAAPDSVELRFLTVKLARYQAQMSTGVEAARYLDVAIEQAKGVLAAKDVTAREKGRAENELSKLDIQRKTVEERDEARRTFGLQIAKQYAKEVYPKNSGSAEIKAFQEAVKSLTEKGAGKGTAPKVPVVPPPGTPASGDKGAAPAATGAAPPAQPGKEGPKPADGATAATAGGKPETKPEAKPEGKPEAKPEAKKESQPALEIPPPPQAPAEPAKKPETKPSDIPAGNPFK